MANINITIKNLPQIKRAFGMSPRLMTKNLNLAIQRTVFTVGRGSRQRTPVDTGRLRASTYEKFGNLKGEVGTNTDYDMFVHDGTRFMKGRPYMRDSVESNQYNVDKYMYKAVQDTLDEIARQT